MTHQADLSDCLTSRYLNLVLLPTEQCNFRCAYCYENFELGAAAPAVVCGIKNLLAHRMPDLDLLRISWFRGEPLMGLPVIREISDHVQQLRRSYSGISFESNITTNGFLLDLEVFQELTARGVSIYQISIDGPPDVHNKTRLGRGGYATFDRIWANLLAIRDSQAACEVILRVHFSDPQWTDLFPLIDMINEAFASDPRFLVHFKSIDQLGGPNDSAIPALDEDRKNVIRKQLLEALQPALRRYHLNDPAFPYVCYASHANSFVVRPNGDVLKCTVALEHAANRVGYLREDGSLVIDDDRLRPWLRGLFSGDAEALACPWHAISEGSSLVNIGAH